MARRVTWTAANGTLWVTLQEQRPGITPAEVVELHRLGFRIDMRTDSWAKFS